MTDRQSRLLLGLALLALLYFNNTLGVEILIGYLLFEGITGWRLPLLVNRLLAGDTGKVRNVQPLNIAAPVRFQFAAERALRLTIALILLVSVWIYPQQVWWMAWFVGFALLGAGISGVCPMLTSLRMLGFR